MVCTSLGSLLRPLFYFLCYIHFSLSVVDMTLETLDAPKINAIFKGKFGSLNEKDVAGVC